MDKVLIADIGVEGGGVKIFGKKSDSVLVVLVRGHVDGPGRE